MKFKHLTLAAASVVLLTSCQCKTTDDSDLKNAGYNRGYDMPMTRDQEPECPPLSQLPKKFVLDRVFFGFDRYDITAEGQAALEKQAEWLQANPGQAIMIEGNCDERGTREYNIGLGERRANAVKEYLVALGVNPARISVTSNGKDAPWVAGSNPDAWAQNRNATTVKF